MTPEILALDHAEMCKRLRDNSLVIQHPERERIADEIDRSLQPRGVLVVIEAEHLCMTMRGVRTPGTLAVTSAVRGQFRDDAATRAEAMDFIRGR